MGAAEPLGALPAFLAVLTTNPTGSEVASALVSGPLAPFGADAAHVARYDGTGLVVVGRAGRSLGETGGSSRFPRDEVLPSTRALLEHLSIIGDGGALSGVVAFPLVASGTAVGVVEFECREQRTWSSLDFGLLDALGAAIGMWLTATVSDANGGPADPVLLTSRQRRILTCVLRGRTNAAIASSLGYSNSTVKQDISRAMRHLGTTTRHEAALRAADLGLLDESS